MARFAKRIGLGALGLLAGLGAPRLAAQSWAVTASDPVGIARSGAGVAFGQSLEAVSLNPALLVTLKERASAFVGVGQELQITQTTLQTNWTVQEGLERNRFLPSFGAAWKVGDNLALGLKLDEPFMRHTEQPLTSTSRFMGESFKLETHRLEAQAGWSLSPNWSIGASLGATQIQYAWRNMVRVPVLANTTGAALGLMELALDQSGSKTVPSYSLGARWAVSPRWTLAAAYVGSMHADMNLSSGMGSIPATYYDLSGFGNAAVGTESLGPAAQKALTTQPGSGKLTLPGKFTLGVRQRYNAILTWEADFRYVQGSATVLPGYPTVTVPPSVAAISGSVITGNGLSTQFTSGFGASLAAELALGKRWVVRAGISQDSNLRDSLNVDPMVGGAKNFTASAGAGFKVAGGELNLGYQFRQAQDIDSQALNYKWDLNGQHSMSGTTRVEGMGHLWAIAFKKAF